MEKLLIVDDAEDVRKSLEYMLQEEYQVRLAANGPTALEMMKADKPDMLITDILMPDMDGYQLIVETLKLDKNMPVLVITGGGRNTNANALCRRIEGTGVVHSILRKPFSVDEFKKEIWHLLTQAKRKESI